MPDDFDQKMSKHNGIGLGMAAIGRPQYINVRQELSDSFSLDSFNKKGLAMLDHAYDKGIRYFDTAPGYGIAEKMLIEWLTDNRDKRIEVATKWGYTYVANFDPQAALHELKEHSIQKLKEQWTPSKALLPHLSTYQIHSATFETGVLDNQAVLDELARLRNDFNLLIGVTVSGSNQLEVLKRALDVEVNGRQLFEAFQVTYNIFDQSLGSLSGVFTGSNKRLIIKEAMANGRIFPNQQYPHYQGAYLKLEALAHKYEVGVDAIALRFCLDSLPTYKVLSGAANQKHLLENIKALQFTLSPQEVEDLQSFAVEPSTYWNERSNLAWN